MRTALVSVFDENLREVGRLSEQNKCHYAAKHQYDFFQYTENLCPGRPAAWSKIVAILKHLDDYDYIFWTDADSLIMNFDVELENLIRQAPYADVIATFDRIGLNTGAAFFRNSPWTSNMLRAAWKQVQFLNHLFWEQAAIGWVLDRDFRSTHKVALLPQAEMNSYADVPATRAFALHTYEAGDFLIHFAGIRGPQRKVLMKQYFEQAQKLNAGAHEATGTAASKPP